MHVTSPDEASTSIDQEPINAIHPLSFLAKFIAYLSRQHNWKAKLLISMNSQIVKDKNLL